ncbi:hypothetical protein OBBRIDRAFT_824013 [Obba rivulosa]|uniref:Uncharacterized protein n=1 Tax=Obba rivulosa TaxID=1052685 RepID=A0A8E2DPY7_9APHY|nr:hypothetical protein OBBRIDRAFT_824013 [Obba rivulosa]
MEAARSLLNSVNPLVASTTEDSDVEPIIGYLDATGVLTRKFSRVSRSMTPTSRTFCATLPVQDTDDVTGGRAFTGTIGPAKISLVFDDGMEISGKLVNPLDRQKEITGISVWVKTA